ncbi:alpha/beta fold hydrolase [Micromonospora orduensis]|uniref:Alpha/beta fold hydrolase n=1 Tax=Micromonospora orduensis TaxID=1420891 RepID=A0A5C4QWD8_9ACTN|nr:alpha/beta fold hydrolase [Micromonospora orduensis]TNH30283.1 alpha/beta fold hydrolase [Micromonospora orduensis]
MRRGDRDWLAHSRRGDGPPLVLIHGIGSRWQVWSPVLDEVARHRDVIALDLSGFGASPPWPEPPAHPSPGSVEHLADRVAAFLDALGVHRPAVAGNSLGGGIALELGRRGLTRSVIAFSPIGFWGAVGRRWCQLTVGGARSAAIALRPALPRLLASQAGRVTFCGLFYGHPGRLGRDECVDSAVALADAPGFAAALAAFAGWQLRRETTGALDDIPVTVAWGTRDLVLPYPTQARRARAALPAARHVPLPGCGHLPFADDPKACARLLINTY